MREPQIGDRVRVTQSGMFDGAEGAITEVIGPIYMVRLDNSVRTLGLFPSEFDLFEAMASA